MTIVPASTYDDERLATLMTASYAGYFVPVVVDATSLRGMVDAWDIDLDRSFVALGDDGEPVGIVLLAVRGDRGWVGGLGVLPEARRGGIGRALMERVLAAAPPHVTLEVIEQNTPALELYEQLGFVRSRVLELWALDGEVPAAEAREAEPAPLGQPDAPWQRADASLPAEYVRLEVDGGAIVFRIGGPLVSILQLQADGEEEARALICAAAQRGETLRYINLPDDEPASAALAGLGGRLELRQFELVRYAH